MVKASDKARKAGGMVTATPNLRLDESFAASRRNRTNSKLSGFYKRYDSDMADNTKFFSGEGSRLDNYISKDFVGPYKYSSQQYKDEAAKLLSGLERDRGFMSAEEYLAHAQILNGIINQDTAEYDRQINDLWSTKLSMGGNDAYKKALEIYRTNSRLGLSSNPTYSEVEKLLGGDTLNDSDREYLENMKKSPELIDTMSADEIAAVREKNKVTQPERLQNAQGDIDIINGLQNYFADTALQRSVKGGRGLDEAEEQKRKEQLEYIRGKYGDEFAGRVQRGEVNLLRPEDENIILGTNNYDGSIAYYDEQGNAMSWANLEYNKRLSPAFASVTDTESENYNSKAASAYEELKNLDAANEAFYWLKEHPGAVYEENKNHEEYLKQMQTINDFDKKFKIGSYRYYDEDSARDWTEKRDTLKKRLDESLQRTSGYGYDDYNYYESLQKDAAKKAENDAKIDKAVRSANEIPVVGKAAWLGSAIAAIPGSLLSGFDYLENAIQSIGHSNADDMSTYRPVNTSDDWATNYASGVIGSQIQVFDEALQEMGVPDGWRKFWTSTYSGVASGINSLATVAGSCALFGPEAGQVVASVILSGQAASSSVQEAVQSGSTTKEALEYGFASGVAEYLGEKISIGSFVDKFLSGSVDTSSVKNFFKSFGKNLPKMLGQGAVEGSEEVFTSLMNTFADAAINGDHTQLKNSVQKYINSGMSEEEAKSAAFKDYMVDIAEQAWGGFVGGVMGGTAATLAGGVRSVGNSVKNSAYNYADNLQTGADALRRFDSPAALSEHIKNELGLSEENYQKLFNAADKVSKIKDKDGKYSSRSYRKAGKLTAEAEAAIIADMPNTARSEIESELTLRGMDKGDSEKYAGYINDKFFGKEIGADAKKAISENETAAGLSNELGTFDEENGSDFKAYLKDAVIRKAAEKINELKNYGRSEENGFHVSDDDGYDAPADDTGISQTVKNSELRISGEIGEVVGENENGEVTVKLDGKTVPLDRVNFQSNAEAVLYSFAKDMSVDSANDMISQARKVDMTAERASAFASAWKLAYDMGYAKRSIDTTLRALQGYSLSKEQIKLAHARGGIADAKYQENEIRKMKEQTRGRGRGNVTYESGAKSKVTKEQQLIADVLAEVGYNIKFENSADGANGSFSWGSDTITVNLGEGATEIFGETLSHELVHSIKKESPENYGELTAYVAAEMGEDTFEAYVLNRQRAENMSYEDAVDETVARSLSEMLENSQALTRFAEKHMSIFEKIAKTVKDFITRISDAIKSLYGERSTLMPIEARELMNRAEELQQMFDRALENTLDSVHDRAYDKTGDNKKSTTEERVQNSAKSEKKNFVEDKYFERQIRKWEGLNLTGYIRVGEITANSPLNLVGMPASSLYFDISKITKAMGDHGDHLNTDIMAQIPKLLNDPIVITEYKPGEHTNTVNVYGELVVNESPVVVGIVATLNLNGKNYINKVRTVHARRDFMKNINVSSVLYLNENEKKTKQWFQTWGQHVPASVTKFGLIRSIQLNGENVNSKTQNSSKEISTEFDKVQYSLKGVNKDGIEVYETSKRIRNLPRKQRIKMYLDAIKKDFRGRTARFEKNGEVYYAEFEIRSARKPIYGEKNSSNNGVNSLINVGAEGDIFDLVENSKYNNSAPDTKGHKVTDKYTDYFDYFYKSVQIDGVVYDLNLDIKKSKKSYGGYIYTLKLNENNKIEASPAKTPISNDKVFQSQQNASADSISKIGKNVNSKTQNSSKEISTDRLIEALRETAENEKEIQKLDEWVNNEACIKELRKKDLELTKEIKALREQLPENFVWATRASKKLLPKYSDKIDRLEKLQEEQRDVSREIKEAERGLTWLTSTRVFNDLMRRVARDTRYQVTKRYSGLAQQRILSEEYAKIQRIREKLSKMLLNPRPGAYVPRGLDAAVAKVLKALNYNRMNYDRLAEYDEKLKKYNEQIENAENIGDEANAARYSSYRDVIVKKRNQLLDRQESLKAALRAVREELDKFIVGNEGYTGRWKDEVDDIFSMVDDIPDMPIDSMTYEQLVRVTAAMNAVYTIVNNTNKVIIRNREMDAAKAMRGAIKEIRASEGYKNDAGGMVSGFVSYNLSPERFFKKISGYTKNSVMSGLYDECNAGQYKCNKMRMEFILKFDDLVRDKKARTLSDISSDKLVDIGLTDNEGKRIPITRGMMLYMYFTTLYEQNRRHFYRGGITVPDFKKYYKGGNEAFSRTRRVKGHMAEFNELYDKLDELREKLKKDDRAIDGDEGRLTAEEKAEIKKELQDTHKLLAAELRREAEYSNQIHANIKSLLTAYERKWIDRATEFFDNDCKKYLNETTEKLYGYVKTISSGYFPIISDKNYLGASFESVIRDASIENWGSMKARKNASNPILMHDITKVIEKQIDSVSKYCGIMPAVVNFENVYGKYVRGYDGSVLETLKSKWGEKAAGYIEDYLRDLQGAGKADRSMMNKIFNFAKGNYASAVLTLNLNATAVQAASLPTASPEIGGKYVRKALKDFFRPAPMNIINKYTALMWVRKNDGSDISVADMSRARSTQYMRKKINERLTWLTGWISGMDAHTVGTLWKACEYNIQDNFKELEIGTDKYYEKVAELFNRMVERTQPNYTVSQRPAILRDSNMLAKSFAMFMTQRLQNYNIIYDAAAEFKNLRKQKLVADSGVTESDVKTAGKKLRSAVISQLVANITVDALKILSELLTNGLKRFHDDDGELTWQSFWIGFLDLTLDTLAGNILFGSQLYEMFVEPIVFGSGGFDMDLTGVNSMVDFINDLKNFENDPDGKKARKFALSLSRVLALPVDNGYKLYNAVAQRVKYVKENSDASFSEVVFDAFVEKPDGVTEHRKKSVYRSIISGNDEKTESLREKYGEDFEDIEAASLKKYDDRIKDAVNLRLSGDTRGYADIFDDITGDGFDAEIVSDVISSEQTSLLNLAKNAAIAKAESNDKDYADYLKKMTDREYGKKFCESLISDQDAAAEAAIDKEAEDAALKGIFCIYDKNDIYLNLEKGDFDYAGEITDTIFEYKRQYFEAKGYSEKDVISKSKNSVKQMFGALYKNRYKYGDDAERERIKNMLLKVEADGKKLYKQSDFDSWGE